MTVEDYSFAVANEICEFRGTFVCVECRNPRKTRLEIVFEKLASFWKNTKSIKVGVDGVEYEVDGVEYEKATSDEK